MSAIRPEKPDDANAIRRVHVAAFPTPAEASLVDALRRSGRLCVSRVALIDEQVVGHIAFSPLNIDGGVGLAPVAVLPAQQRRGHGSALIRAGIDACRQRGDSLIVVLGDPAYYRRFGFRPAAGWNLRDEYGGGDAFAAIVLDEARLPQGGGLVRYAPEFAALDDASH